MNTTKFLWFIQSITSASVTATSYSILYIFFMTSSIPEEWSLREMYAFAMIGSFVVGALSRLWTHSLVASCVGTAAGIFAGGTWIGSHFSDTNIGIRFAAWSYVSEFGFRDLLLFAPAIIAWVATNWTIKRTKIPAVFCRNRVAILVVGALLAAILFNVLAPTIEFLSFTRHDVRGLRHWEFVILSALFLDSLVFGALAGVLYKGPILFRSVFWGLIVGIIVLPHGYSSRLAGKIRHDGLLSMTERLRPLITAIETFQKHEKKLPNSLNDLVPVYLPTLPKTNSGAYPDYEYSTHISQEKPMYYLRIWVPTGIMNFDELEYSSNGKYSVIPSPGEYWEPIIGNWAYYHE